MRRLRLASLLWFTSLSVGCASVFTPPPPPTDPLAYAIEAPDGAHALLFGSVHVGRPDQHSLPAPIAQALADASVLVLEIDLSATTQAERTQALLELGTLEDGLRLQDVLSHETWETVVTAASESDVELARLDRLEPWVVALHFTSLMFESAGLVSEHGVESHAVEATEPTLPMRGLETLHDQFGAFDSLPLPVQERLLQDTLAPPSDTASEEPGMPTLFEAWRTGDGETLEALVFPNRQDPLMAPFYEATFFRRNENMADALAALLSEESNAFVIVGVGHLLGERGIPALLERNGFRVERFSSLP